jgi:hypothetical protein
MTSSTRTILVGAMVFACLSSVASGVDTDAGFAEAFKGIGGLRVEPKEALAANYPGTVCVDVSMVGSGEKLGFVCRSNNKEFVSDMGISAYDSLPQGARPKQRSATGLVVGTPMAQYDMRPFAATIKGSAAAAEIDCDTESGSIYRARATCHVAVSRLDLPTVVYSNFVLKLHTDGKSGISHEQIRKIWRRLVPQ